MYKKLISISLLSIIILNANEDLNQARNILSIYSDAKAYIKKKIDPPRKLEEPKKVEVKKEKNIFEKMNEYTKKWNNLVKETSKDIKKFSDKYGLDIGVDTTEVGVSQSVSWSLVDKDCNLALNGKLGDFMKEEFIKYIEQQKEAIKSYFTKEYWKMWTYNKIIQLTAAGYSTLMCNGALKWMDFVPKEQFKTDYKKCIDEQTSDTIKTETYVENGMDCIGAGKSPGASNAIPVCAGYQPGNPTIYYIPPCDECGIYTGKPFRVPHSVVKQGNKINTKKIAIGISVCYPRMFTKYYSQGIDKCMDHYMNQFLSIFNGNLQFGLKFFGLKFSAAQQECILNKYKSKIEISNVEAKYFSINKDTLNTTESDISSTLSFKGTPTSNIKTLNDTNSFVVTNLIPYTDSRYVKYRFLLPDYLGKTNKIIVSNIYYSILRNWTDYVFNQNYGFVAVDKPEEGYKGAKIPKGRWGFSIYIKNKREYFNELGKFKDYFITSIYDHCQNLVSKGTLENYKYLISKDKLLPLLKEKVYKDTGYSLNPNYPKILDYHDESIYNFFLFRPKDNLKWVFGGESYKKEIEKYGLKYNFDIYNEFLITDMLQSCKNWATKYKDSLYEDLKEMSVNRTGNTIGIEGEKEKKNINKTYDDLFKNTKQSIKKLTHLIKQSNMLILKHENNIQKILDKYKKEQKQFKTLNKTFQ